jgi:hypothetical protein
MARSTRGAQSGSRVRAGLVAHMRRFQEAFPTPGWEPQIRAIEGGAAVELDTRTLFSAVYRFDPNLAGRLFSHRADPENKRRFVLDEDDELTELVTS